MATVKSKPLPSMRYRAAYVDRYGKQRWFTGTHSKTETRRIAEKKEADEREIRLGYREAPGPERLNGSRFFDEVASEYLAWGKAQGGRGGRPWSRYHAQGVQSRLAHWQKQIPLTRLDDVKAAQGRVEEIMRDLLQIGPAGKPLTAKTINEYVAVLKAFCQWCVDRRYLVEIPIKSVRKINGQRKKQRRALNPEELRQLLAMANLDHRLLYLVAITTGLRVNELRMLTPQDFDWQTPAIILRPEWTKNRKDGLQPLPQAVAVQLREYIASGAALRRYGEHHARYGGKHTYPKTPALYVPSHAWRDLQKDLERAGVPVRTDEGEVDFHALRVAYSTLVVESGATVKEAQDLCRHSDPSLTMNIYARSRNDRLHAVAESVAERIGVDTLAGQQAHSKHDEPSLPETAAANVCDGKGLQQATSANPCQFESLRPGRDMFRPHRPWMWRLGFRSFTTPSVSTLYEIFMDINIDAIETLLGMWLDGLLGHGRWRAVSLDGKTCVTRPHPRSKRQACI